MNQQQKLSQIPLSPDNNPFQYLGQNSGAAATLHQITPTSVPTAAPDPLNAPSAPAFRPLHACNASDFPPQNTQFYQLAALYRDLYNRLLLLQMQALPTVMQQSPAGAQIPSYNSVTSNALAAPPQSLQNACVPLALQTPADNGLQGAELYPTSTAVGAMAAATNQTQNVPFGKIFAQIEAAQPDYFAQNPVRAELKDYICQNCTHLHDDEIIKILHLAKNLENQAVESFKAAQGTADLAAEKQKLIQDANRAAISKLATNSATAKPQSAGSTRIFTRAQISAMSPQEFKKHQAEIFAQYANGLIK